MVISWQERLVQHPELKDMANWPPLSLPENMPKRHRGQFIRNQQIVSQAIAGVPQVELASKYGIAPARVSQLLERALGGDEALPPLLRAGLVPHFRPRPSVRRQPLGTLEQPRGARCSFRHLLDTVVGLKAYLDKHIRASVRQTQRGQNLGAKILHQMFLRYLIDQQWPENTYPFTDASQGYESVRRYYNEQVNALKTAKPRSEVLAPVAAPMRVGEEIEIDAQLTDVYGSVVIQLNDQLEPLRLARIMLLVARDCASGAVLGHHLTLSDHPNQDDLLTLLDSLTQPWEPLALTTPGLVYPPGACLPSGLGPHYPRIILGRIRLDNALEHLAHSVRDYICNELGATLNLGIPKQPKKRHVIEQAFAQLNHDLHRFRSTSGSHPNDPVAEPARYKKKAPVLSLTMLDEALSVITAFNNTRPQPSLGGHSPLDVWRYQMANNWLPLNPVLQFGRHSPFWQTEIVTVRKSVKEHRSPYIQFKGVRHSGPGLARPELINQKIQIRMDRRDIRIFEAFTLDGEPLGTLLAPKSWQRFPHSIATRQRIHKEVRNKRIRMGDPLLGLFNLLLSERHKPSVALELVHLCSEYGLLDQPKRPDELNHPESTNMTHTDNPAIPEWNIELLKKRDE